MDTVIATVDAWQVVVVFSVWWVCWTAQDMLDDWIRHLERHDERGE